MQKDSRLKSGSDQDQNSRKRPEIAQVSHLFIASLITLLFGIAGLAATLLWQRSIDADAARFKPIQAKMLNCRLLMGESSYWIKVKYEYRVVQNTYISTKVERFPGGDCGASNDLDYWESLENRYKQGNVVNAWYNPDNPAEAYLLNHTSLNLIYFFYVLAGMIILTGVVLQAVYWIMRIKNV